MDDYQFSNAGEVHAAGNADVIYMQTVTYKYGNPKIEIQIVTNKGSAIISLKPKDIKRLVKHLSNSLEDLEEQGEVE